MRIRFCWGLWLCGLVGAFVGTLASGNDRRSALIWLLGFIFFSWGMVLQWAGSMLLPSRKEEI